MFKRSKIVLGLGSAMGLSLALITGGAAGVGAYTFAYADGASYLTNDATACSNCHVMQPFFDAWTKSSHHAVATCNDCHAPHDSVIGKLVTKATNGFNHSMAFTTGRFHEPIQISSSNRKVTEGTCRACHQDIVYAIDSSPRDGQTLSCIRCHVDVGHMR